MALKKGLGRGLEALFGEVSVNPEAMLGETAPVTAEEAAPGKEPAAKASAKKTAAGKAKEKETAEEAGDSVLFFPLQFHSSLDEENIPKHSFIAISFLLPENNFASLLPLKNRVLRLSDEDFAALKDIAGAFFNEKGAVSHSEAVLKLAGILLHQLEMTGSTDPEMLSGGGAHHKIFDFIRSNFDKQLSVKTLAVEFGRSPESIRKIFQKYFPGLTPGRLIAKLQMQQAVELLENTESSIGDIAEKCGYSDTFTFSKKFKKVIGLSPREYRAQLLQSNGAGQ